MNNPFCSYNIIASDTSNLPPYSGKLQEYWMAGNGIFLRSHRPELEVCLEIARGTVGNLPQIQPYFRLLPPKVPASTISEIIQIYETALIEIHSHAGAPACFSTQDDIEESGKFRIFAVIGSLPEKPSLSVRLGVYDRFFSLPTAWIFAV
ncbi:hypothetical protein IQ272_33055 [Chroococcidiopsidales cyanobacterium LEGE 13417]|nr:hypothetical protein [Chroococcidiopsidales cyanobacterium LEGE 13417]